MDFLALPRRDLQALCKRNGVRANMTNAAMADALRALPKVDGIEEYVKQPVPVPEPPVQAVLEEKNVGKQGNPLPRGRRAVAKSSEPVEPEEDNEEEKGNAKRQSSKEDAPALGVGRRGASWRARPVPVVPQPLAVAEEEMKRESKTDNLLAPVVGRRGASRRARPSPAMAAQAAESEVAGAEEEQREEVENLKQEATMDDVPALGVGRRGVNGLARAVPSVAALGGKVVAEEEQRAPIPRGRRAKAKGSSAEPIRLDDSDDEEKEDAKPEEQQEDAQIVDVGRRGGASRRAQAAPIVAAPEAKAEEEQRAPVPRGRRVKANSTELIRLDDSKEEKKDDTKPEEEREDAPAIGARRRDASGRAPAPSEAPATRRNAAASKSEAGDVAVEAVPIRATRQRKPTMKAAAAAEDKAPRRATRRGEVMSTLLQQEVHEEPHEAVGAPDTALEAVPIRATRQRKPTLKAAAAATVEEMAPPRSTRRGAVMRTVLQPEAQEEPQEAAGAPVCYQQCDALEELEEASDPQKQELNKVDASKQDEDQDLVIIEDEKLMEETPAEEPSVTDQECTDKSEMQEQLVDDEKCHAPLAIHEESPILGLVSIVTEQASEDDKEAVDAPVSHLRCNALEELAEASDPQKEELNEVDTPKQDEDQDVVISEDEMLMEETPAEESSVIDDALDEPKDVFSDTEAVGAPVCYQQCEDQDLVIIEDEKLMEESSVTDKECTDKSEMQEQLVDNDKFHAPLAIHEKSPILGLVSMVTEQASEDDKEAVDASVSHLRCDALEELAEASDPQKKVDAPKQDEDQDVVISEYEMLMEETPAEELSITDDAQDEPEEALGALISYQRCDDLEELAEASDPQKEELNEVNAPKRDEDQDLVIIKDEKLMEEIPAEEAYVTDQECKDKSEMQEQLVEDEKCHAPLATHEESPILGLVSTVTEQASEDNEEAVDALVSHQRCDAMEELADASDPQKEELNEVDAPKQDEDHDVIIIEDEKLMEETIVEESSVTHQEWTDNSKMQEQQVDDENCHALLATHKESPILGLVSTVTEQASQDDVGASFQDNGVSCSGLLDKGVCEHTYDAAEEMELVPGVRTLQAPLTGNESDASDANHESEMGNFNEVLTFREEISEVDTQEVSKKKEHMDIALLLSDIVDEAGFLDCSSNISQVAEEINEKVNTVGVEANEEVNTEDGPGCQEEGDVVVGKVLHYWVDNTILLDCSSDISWVVMEKAGNITSETPENRAALDEDGGEQMEVITTDKVLELTGSHVENVGEKHSAEPMAVLEEKGVKVARECEDLTKLSLRQLKGKLKATLNAKKNKEAKKRVALARVDENVCRSHAKRQH